MDETVFWADLEYRVCRELAGLEDCRRLGLWCDGLIPDQYILGSSPPCIIGRAWMGFGKGEQDQWEFKLTLCSAPLRPADIVWSELLPAEEVTEWLLVDIKRKYLEMAPGAAVPPES